MTTHNTGNPLGSTDPRDLYDNAENLDKAVNSSVDKFQDRLGKIRLTWSGIIKAGTGNPGVIVPIVQQAAQDAASAVIAGVDGRVAVAQSAAGRAETALAEVEQALALSPSGIYPDIASGLAGTISTENFWVIPNEGDGIENLTLYNNNGSEAIKLYELYNLEPYMVEEGSDWEAGEL